MINTVLKTMRPSFLVLTLACVFLGFCTSFATGTTINSTLLALIFIGAMSAHISVNMLNEYHDFKSGLDFKTKKTPFSSGSGALPNNPKIAKGVLFFGLLALFITIAIGIYFITTIGGAILPIGLVGLVLIVTYTQWLNRCLYCV
jgi:1,4-dihydroxy-2-naphthoate octaprenyltransferase